MSENPYAAPKAPVGDIEPEPEVRVRPPQIKLVIQLVIANYLLGLGIQIYNWDFFSRTSGPVAFVLQQLLGLALGAWFYYKIWQGRNWARIVLLVFTLAGMALIMTSFYQTVLATMPVAVKRMTVLGSVIGLVIMYLLFLSPGREWFRKRQD